MNSQNQPNSIYGKNNLLVEVRPYSFVVGEIIDISLNGLTFCYRHRGNQLKDFFEINLWKNNRQHIDGIMVKNMSDSDMDDRTIQNSKGLRRCDVRFFELTSNQQSRLKYFVQNTSENPLN